MQGRLQMRGALHCRVPSDLAAVPQPNASGLADANRNAESGRSVERARGYATKHRDKLEGLSETIPESPPDERSPTYGPAELGEGPW
jgi:hypothetical protein